MEQFFGFRNFRQFERSRREIRLPYDLLNDLRFRQLPDASKAHLICLLWTYPVSVDSVGLG
jgi:hypothetical protein